MVKRKKKSDNNGPTSPFALLSLLFTKNTALTSVFMIAIVLFGAVSYTSLLRREGFPPVAVPITVATGTYFVDDANLVDQDITLPLSEVVSEIEGVSGVTTFADNNFFQMVANLETDVDSKIGTERIEAVIADSDVLPAEAQIDFLEIDAAKFLAEYDMLVSVYSTNGASAQELDAQAQSLAEQIQASDLVGFAEAEPLFETGLNPATGDTVVEQTSFGRFGEVDQAGGFEYFPSAVVGIIGEGGEDLDIFALSDDVKQTIATVELAQGFDASVSADFTDEINTQINSLQSNVVTGLIAVTIISLIMISWRVSVLSVIFMVSVIFVTAGILYLFGYTLNTITLFALVLSLGLFVDDATIISESIDANKSKKLSKEETIKKSIGSIGSASAAGTLTTVLVFVPLLFVTGIIGSFIFLLPVTVIISLIVSLLLSLTLIPFLSQFTILTESNLSKTGWHNPVPDYLARMILLVKTKPMKGIPIGIMMVSISLISIVASGFFATKLTFNVFPPSKDSDQILVQLTFPDNSSIIDAENTVDEVNEVIVSVVGENIVRSSYTRDSNPSARSATALIELVPFSERDTKSPVIIEELEKTFENYTAANVEVGQLDAGPPVEQFPFKLQINAEDFEQGFAAANDIQEFLSGNTVERQNGTTANITGTKVDNITNVVRKDGKRIVQVLAAYDADDVTALLQQTQLMIEEEYTDTKLDAYGLSASDLGFDFGQESENEESFSSLGNIALVAVGVMFVLLAIQFRSLLEPLLIFLALPFSLLGVTFGLFISNNPLSFFAMIGLIGLIGIAVNNTILLTDRANRARREGMDPVEAIAEATRRRFRPLITTTATTVAALTPLALVDPFWEPLAITIMFGLISSTILVIIAFPYYYMAAAALTTGFKKLVLRR